MAHVLAPGELEQIKTQYGFAEKTVKEFSDLTPDDQKLGLYKSIEEFGPGRGGAARKQRSVINSINDYATKNKLPVQASRHSDGIGVVIHTADGSRRKRAGKGEPTSK